MRTSHLSILTAGLAILSACAPKGDVPGTGTAALPFLADDYPAALAEARARDLPLFVESWAPW
ncbi:hypothetical protein K8I85_05445 [bacterium]|nr:hypothetical protein [bacterium]